MKIISNNVRTFFKGLSRWFSQFSFKETKFYKIIITPLIKVSFTVLGGTLGIWGYYILLNVIFVKVFPTAIWPGINSFIEHGEIIIISFAFLAEALYYSTRDSKFNLLNMLSGAWLLGSLFLYARVIALKNSGIPDIEHDEIIFNVSPWCFFTSIAIFYLVILREKYREEFGDVQKRRDHDLDDLENRFSKS